MHTRAEDVLKGKEMDVAKKIVEENSHLLRRWFVNDLLDLGWSAYILGKDEVAEISTKEAICEIGECDEYQEYLNDANQLISVIYASPNVRVKDSNLSKEIGG